MIWAQTFGSFCIWLVAGYLTFRVARGSERVKRLPRFWSPVLMLFGGVIMIGGIFLTAQAGGISQSVLTLGGWISSTVIGSVFVAMQTLGAVIAVSQISSSETPKDN